jgi:uncharacterized protein (DUF2336 family)
MRFLAQDEIIIAEPVILESPVLTDDDLCAIARFGSLAHVAKLRLRKSLPAHVQLLLDRHNPKEIILLEALRKGDMQLFRATLSEIAGPGIKSALDDLAAGKGDALAAACKQAGLSRATYSAIVLLVDKTRNAEITEALLFAYEPEQNSEQTCGADQAA